VECCVIRCHCVLAGRACSRDDGFVSTSIFRIRAIILTCPYASLYAFLVCIVEPRAVGTVYTPVAQLVERPLQRSGAGGKPGASLGIHAEPSLSV